MKNERLRVQRMNREGREERVQEKEVCLRDQEGGWCPKGTRRGAGVLKGPGGGLVSLRNQEGGWCP